MTKIKNPKQILEKYKIRPSKRLGQNFLIDENVLEKIIKTANLSSEDVVLEIGPGLGILTLELAKRAKKVIAIEKDKKIYEILKNILENENIKNVEIINQDTLKVGSNFFHDREKILTNYKLVANLPYYITSPVIRKFLEAENPPREMVLMVQKEIAQRICALPAKISKKLGRARPPHMNLLAIAVQFYAQPQIISYVSKDSFWPQPKVDSAIIKITPTSKKSEMLFLRLQGGVINLKNNRGVVGSPPCRGAKITSQISDAESLFFQLVKAGFSSKRKMLKNNLLKKFKIQNSKIKIIFQKLNINPKTRAENLSVEDWIKLYKEIYSPR